MKNEFNEEWPERINVMKLVTYETESIYEQILEDNRSNGKDIEVDIDDIIEMIHHYASNDFSCGYGHEANVRDLIFQDENGEEY